MKQSKPWFSENADAKLNRKILTAEIHRIAALKGPLSEKMQEIRYLVESYFKIGSNEEMLNANLP